MSKTIEIKVPDIGDFKDVPVIEVLVSEGDGVKAEDGLVTLESDKATMEVPSPAAGVIREIRLKVDDTVSEGDVVAILEVSDEAAEPEPSEPEQASLADLEEQSPETPGEKAEVPEAAGAGEAEEAGEIATGDEPEPVAPQAPAEPDREGRAPQDDADSLREPAPMGLAAVEPSAVPYASPAIRRFARELGVDLLRVSGSGDRGRILREDVNAYVKSVMTAGAVPGAAPGLGGLRLEFPQLPEFDFSRYGGIERQPLSRIQKISSGHLHRNWVGIPHVTQHDEADITDMEAFRQANAEEALAKGFKLTPLVFLIKAMVA